MENTTEKKYGFTIGTFVAKDEDSYQTSVALLYGSFDVEKDTDTVREEIDEFLKEKYPQLPTLKDYLDGNFDFDKLEDFIDAISEIAEVQEVPKDGWCLDVEHGINFLFPIDRTTFSEEDFLIQVDKTSELHVNNLVAYLKSFAEFKHIYISEHIFFALVEIEGKLSVVKYASDLHLYVITIEDIIGEYEIEDFTHDDFDEYFYEACEEFGINEDEVIGYNADDINGSFVWVD